MLKTRNKETPKKTFKRTRAGKTEEIVKAELNEKQKLFCELYIADKECFGNKAKSYQRAFGMKDSRLNAARSGGYSLYTNPYIQEYIKKLLKDRYKTEIVDNELVKVITQDKDLQSKVRGIEHYNKINERIREAGSNNTFVFKFKDSKKPIAPQVVQTTIAPLKRPISKGNFKIKEGR